MGTRPLSVILVVVLSISAVVVICVGTVAICAIRKIPPPPEVLSALKDWGGVALGGLVGLLASTRTGEPGPSQPVTITNPPSDPVPTTETKP